MRGGGLSNVEVALVLRRRLCRRSLRQEGIPRAAFRPRRSIVAQRLAPAATLFSSSSLAKRPATYARSMEAPAELEVEEPWLTRGSEGPSTYSQVPSTNSPARRNARVCARVWVDTHGGGGVDRTKGWATIVA